MDVVYEDVPLVSALVHMALSGETVSAEELVRNRWFRATVTPMHDKDGVIVGAGGVAVDVTETRAFQSFLEWQNQLLERLALGAPADEVLAELASSLANALEGTICVLWTCRDGVAEAVAQDGYGELSPPGPVRFADKEGWAQFWPATEQVQTCSLAPDDDGPLPELARIGIVSAWCQAVLNDAGATLGVIHVYQYSKSEITVEKDYLQAAARVMRTAILMTGAGGIRTATRRVQPARERAAPVLVKRQRQGIAAQESLNLSDAQVRILRLISRGLSNEEIARAVGLSAHTVKDYVSVIARRLGAKNRAHAVALSIDLGLV